MKISRVLILSMAMPLGLAAQTPAAPPAGPPANPVTPAFRGRTVGRQRTLAQALD